jgi:hypothetical protein
MLYSLSLFGEYVIDSSSLFAIAIGPLPGTNPHSSVLGLLSQNLYMHKEFACNQRCHNLNSNINTHTS